MESLTRQHRPAEVKHPILGTIASWDSGIALVVGVGTGVAWWLSDSEAQLLWVLPAIGLSVGLAGLAWNQWNQIQSNLKGTDYGELLRLADPSEDDIRRPYTVVTIVALASAVWATLTGFLINTLSPIWESIFIGVGLFLLTWSGLGVIALKIISDRNDRLIAEVEALREETEAEQRRAVDKRENDTPESEVRN